MIIYLVRHTNAHNPDKVYKFRLPFPLSASGLEHAGRIGDWFKENKIKGIKIYCSPIRRCRQTASFISKSIGTKVVIDRRLIETSCPNLEGKKQPVKDAWKIEEDDPSRESRKDILKRMMSIFSEKVEKGEDCALVSHGDPLTFLYYHLAGKKLPKYLWDEWKKETAKVFRVGEIMRLTIESGDVKSIERITV